MYTSILPGIPAFASNALWFYAEEFSYRDNALIYGHGSHYFSFCWQFLWFLCMKVVHYWKVRWAHQAFSSMLESCNLALNAFYNSCGNILYMCFRQSQVWYYLLAFLKFFYNISKGSLLPLSRDLALQTVFRIFWSNEFWDIPYCSFIIYIILSFQITQFVFKLAFWHFSVLLF